MMTSPPTTVGDWWLAEQAQQWSLLPAPASAQSTDATSAQPLQNPVDKYHKPLPNSAAAVDRTGEPGESPETMASAATRAQDGSAQQQRPSGHSASVGVQRGQNGLKINRLFATGKVTIGRI